MKMNLAIFAAFACGVAAASASLYYWHSINQPKTYSECILKNLKSNASNYVAKTIQAACTDKHPAAGSENYFDRFD